MRSQLVLQGTISYVSESSQSVDITDSNGVIHNVDISPHLPNPLWLSTCGYLRGCGVNVIETEGGQTLTVIQPDVLIDVSEAASAVGTSYTAHLARRLRSFSTIPATVEGSLINGVFDLLVQESELSDDDLVRHAAATRPLAMALLSKRGQATEVEAHIRASIPALRAMHALWQGEHLDLEPFYLSPRWGLQGRADIVRRQLKSISIVEMKAGSVPSGQTAVRVDHAAQVAGYAAIMGSVESEHPIEPSVWYVKAPRNELRPINVEESIAHLIGARNAILLADLALQRGSVAPLQWLQHASAGGSSYEIQASNDLLSTLASCDGVEILALRAWMSMAASLQSASRIGGHGQRSLADVWVAPFEEKRTSPHVLIDLSINHGASNFTSLHIVFHRPRSAGETAIRIGDQVVVYPEPPPHASPCDAALYKGVVRSLSSDAVTIAFRNKFIDASVFDRPMWIVEQDVMDISAKSLYVGLRAFVDADHRARSVLLGRSAPNHAPVHEISADDCTPHQRQIIERALAAHEMMLIQGPPGTGKTSTIIRRVIQELAKDPHERVLVVAYTNRAANELCSVLERHDIAYLRHGSVEGAEGAHAVPQLARILASDELARRITDAPCIVATVQSMYSGGEIWEFGNFTTVIVDEASQILEPALLGITSRVRRSILVGDHCQLPPVLSLAPSLLQTTNQDLHAIELSSLDRSAFERLILCADSRNDVRSAAMLTQQGRMHADIMLVVSDSVYDGNLDTLLAWQRSTERTIWHEVLPHRTMFIPVDAEDQAAAEASCIVRLVTELHASGDTLDVGIITPFRVQNARIRELLPAELRERITVDTVERFQGSERDIIIYGTCVATEQDRVSIESPITVHGRSIDRKLNVAVTRARQQLVIVGNERILRASPSYSAVLDRLVQGACPSS